MKQLLTVLLLFTSLSVMAQFPAPENFSYAMDYIELDLSGECNGQTVWGPAYCSHFNWSFPDSLNTDALFEYFVIYNSFHHETIQIATTPDTSYTTNTPYAGDIWVTAVYSDPNGESGPSNIVNSPGIPINIEERYTHDEKLIHYDSYTKELNVDQTEGSWTIKIYGQNGQVLLKSTKSINYLGNFPPGVYFVLMTDDKNIINRDKVFIQ